MKSSTIFFKRFLFIWALFPILASSQNDAPPVLPLFEEEDILNITITTALNELLKDREDEASYHPATITYPSKENQEISLPIRVKVRGNFRRQKSNCDFPPLMLNFDTLTQHTVFEGQNKLKLVTHCQSRKAIYDQFVVSEYLVYKMYNQLTDSSFRVRLVKVTYKDSEGKAEPLERVGFILEDEGDVAARMGGRILAVSNVHPDKTHYEWVNHLSVFQYMIGNTDWSIAELHNIRLVMINPAEPPLAVPYDFDWSGFVNTPYALPNPDLGIVSVRDRLFRGFCRTEEEFEVTFQLFRNKKADFFRLINENPLLEEKTKIAAVRYLEQFYSIIGSERGVENEFYEKCRTTK
ncbi:MAG: hypothetical protein SF052_05230 [Bacteroidia bacterium]|nr:hypothetical protein [Bacteroidia bacterium]